MHNALPQHSIFRYVMLVINKVWYDFDGLFFKEQFITNYIFFYIGSRFGGLSFKREVKTFIIAKNKHRKTPIHFY